MHNCGMNLIGFQNNVMPEMNFNGMQNNMMPGMNFQPNLMANPFQNNPN